MEASNYDSPAYSVRVSVGTAIGRATELYLRHFLPFFLIGVVACIPFAAWIYYVADTGRFGSGEAVVAMVFLTILSSSFCDAMVIRGTFQAMRGRPVSALSSIKHAASRFFPVVAVSIVSTLIVVVGLLLLLIPGYIASCVLAVAIPVCVIESKSVGDSMSRSASLTRGSRWGIFGLLFCVGIADRIVEFIIAAIFAGSGATGSFAFVEVLWMSMVLSYVAVVWTVVYHDLRAAKEGVDLEQIAAVFD